MSNSLKQSLILKYLRSKENQIATLNEILQNAGVNTYYCNGEKHIGAVLSNMVKNRQLTRVKKGTFKIFDYKEFLTNNKYLIDDADTLF